MFMLNNQSRRLFFEKPGIHDVLSKRIIENIGMITTSCIPPLQGLGEALKPLRGAARRAGMTFSGLSSMLLRATFVFTLKDTRTRGK